ncbi:MAG: protease pro-enzyme activation domain-containing protein [Sedimentisphaerales bacterium]|jgi:hypothetical protein
MRSSTKDKRHFFVTVFWVCYLLSAFVLVIPVYAAEIVGLGQNESGQYNAAGTQRMHGHVPAVVTRLQPVSNLSGSERLRLAIGLPLRNQTVLTELLQRIYDPASPDYRHYLTPEQFTEMFGPTEQDYQAVVSFAKAHRLTVTGTHPDRMLLDVDGSVADIEKAFNVTMRVYQHPTEARTFYAPDIEPSLDLAVPVLHISGLDNYVVPRPMNLKVKSLKATAKAIPNAGSGPAGSYMGNDFRAAYVPGVTLTGVGQSVGLLEFDSGFYQSDITAYETQAGLPNIAVVPVLLDGYDGGPGYANDEVSLDIEMAISMAPGITSVVVYEGSMTNSILSRMATDNWVKQIGASWGYSIDATSEQYFQKFAAQGQSFFNASGDSDAWTGAIYPPSDDKNITIVGGTTLTTSGPGGTWLSETVWNWGGGTGSGGGISTTYSIPSWQQSVSMSANQGSTTMRNIPDVAMVADNIFVICYDGNSGIFGGTSCSTPLWAAFTALVNQYAAVNQRPSIGFINPIVYAIGNGTNYSSCFHDITTGNNTSPSSPNKFYAVAGYDLCTGWGTPAGQNLINTFFAPPVPPVAQDGNANTLTNTPVLITLKATDDGSPNPPGALSYIITSLPSYGTLSDPRAGSINAVPYTLAGNGNKVTYTPVTGYGGFDSFTFKANDGGVPPDGGDSNIATVSITIRFTITATADPNGSISPSGVVVRSIGDSALFTATGNFGYGANEWYLDSSLVQTGGNTYTLTNITANHTVYVTFAALPQYTITAAAGQHGHISPSGAVMVYQGYDKMFTATANPGYIIGIWFVDGNSVQEAGSTYTLHNVQAGHDVLVTFSLPPVALYVDANSPNDTGTGTQSNPFRRLQDGINAVQDCNNTEIWVVAGTYKPTAGSDRTISFVMKQNLRIYGGFTGTETQRQQRNWVAHPTILSGDIGIADDNSDNSFDVVVGDINSILDGFTITDGNANDSEGSYLYGGGIYNQAGDMTIANCKITANSANAGGGVYNAGGNPKIINCTFSENTAGEGGGMYNLWANPAIVNCSFVNNSADSGGGIYDMGGNPAVVNCALTQNSAGSGGGIYDYWSNPALVNCVLIQNSADNGGGIFEFYSNLTISNCTFNGNISANGAVLACDSEEQSYPSTVMFANCIIWNGSGWLWNNDISTANIYYSDVNAGWPGTGNINADPLFMGTDDFRLQVNSPCVDAGSNNLVSADITDIDGDGNTTEPIPFDIAGHPRIADGNGDGVAVVDMGAYEQCGLKTDFNGDCTVDFADFAIMAQEWLTSGIKADIYKDGNNRVDLMDLAVLAEEWLR